MSKLKLAMVAGELSGDTLGAGILGELKKRNIEFEAFGVAGPAMQAQGCESWFDARDISVMGLTEVIRHLPRLLKIKKQLRQRIKEQQPDAFIGIDLPDFNLRLASELRSDQCLTIQYVSPTVWAWRPKRVTKIAAAIDLVLCLFPFEPDFYQTHQVDAVFVGHPLADQLQPQASTHQAREKLGLPTNGTIVALLPGSRASEAKALSQIFVETAALIQKEITNVEFVVAVASEEVGRIWSQYANRKELDLKIHIRPGPAATVIEASDVSLLASGTVALEALLIGRPMVVAYKVSAMTAWIIRQFNLVTTEYFSLPNLLADKEIVPEFLQEQARPELIAPAVVAQMDNHKRVELDRQFVSIREQLANNSNQRAADALLQKLQSRRESHGTA